jgi:hypothetical protein
MPSDGERQARGACNQRSRVRSLLGIPNAGTGTPIPIPSPARPPVGFRYLLDNQTGLSPQRPPRGAVPTAPHDEPWIASQDSLEVDQQETQPNARIERAVAEPPSATKTDHRATAEAENSPNRIVAGETQHGNGWEAALGQPEESPPEPTSSAERATVEIPGISEYLPPFPSLLTAEHSDAHPQADEPLPQPDVAPAGLQEISAALHQPGPGETTPTTYAVPTSKYDDDGTQEKATRGNPAVSPPPEMLERLEPGKSKTVSSSTDSTRERTVSSGKASSPVPPPPVPGSQAAVQDRPEWIEPFVPSEGPSTDRPSLGTLARGDTATADRSGMDVAAIGEQQQREAHHSARTPAQQTQPRDNARPRRTERLAPSESPLAVDHPSPRPPAHGDTAAADRPVADAAAMIEQLRHAVHQLAKASAQPAQTTIDAQPRRAEQSPPPPAQPVIIVKRPVIQRRTPRAFWERRYLRHSRLRSLR